MNKETEKLFMNEIKRLQKKVNDCERKMFDMQRLQMTYVLFPDKDAPGYKRPKRKVKSPRRYSRITYNKK